MQTQHNSIHPLDTKILFTMGECRRLPDGTYGRGTQGLEDPYVHYTLTSGTARSILEWAVSLQESESKIGVQWISPGHYDSSQGKRSQDRVVSGQIFGFDFDGDPDVEEKRVYDIARQEWIEKGMPKGQGPEAPKGRGVCLADICKALFDLQQLGWCYGVSTTHSHNKLSRDGHARIRIFLIADKATTSIEDFRLARLHLVDWFAARGLVADTAPASWSSIFYAPAFPPGAERKWSRLSLEGELFPIEEAIESGKKILALSAKEKRAKGVSAKRSTSAANLGETLPSDTVVELANGRIVRAHDLIVGDKFPCFSPWRPESSASAFVEVKGNGRAMIHDSGDHTTRWVEGWVDSYLNCSESVKLNPCPRNFSLREGEKTVDRGETQNLPGVDNTIKLPAVPATIGSFLSDQLKDWKPSEESCNLLHCCMGSGKTQFLRSLTDSTVITDSIALSRSVAETFSMSLYSDIDFGQEAENPNSVFTIHSSHRLLRPFIPGQWHRENGIIDESPSVFSALHSDPMNGEGWRAMMFLRYFIATSKSLWFASADLRPEHVALVADLVREIRPEIKINHIIRPAVQGNHKIALYSKNKLEELFLHDVANHQEGDAPLVYAMTSQEGPAQMALRVKESNPELRVFDLSSNNSTNPEVQELLRDPNRILREFDVFIYSPTIKTGVSLDLPVKRQYISISTPMAGQDLSQITGRCRNLEDKTMRVYCMPTKGSKTTNPDTLVRLALGLADATEKAIETCNVHWTFEPITFARKATDPLFLRSWVCAERGGRESQNDLTRSFLRACNRSGYECVDRRDQEVSEERTAELAASRAAAREETQAAWAASVVASPLIDEVEAETLARAYTTSLEEKASVEKFNLARFYDSAVDEDLVRLDRKGRKRSEAKAFSLLYFQGKKIRRAAITMDRLQVTGRDRSKSRDVTGYEHYSIRTALYDHVIRSVLGVGVHRMEGLRINASDLATKVLALIETKVFRDRMTEIGKVSTNETHLENPVRWFLGFLKRFGIHHTSQKVRVPGSKKRANVYVFDTEEIMGLSRPNRLRLIETMQADSTPLADLQMMTDDFILTILASLGLTA